MSLILLDILSVLTIIFASLECIQLRLMSDTVGVYSSLNIIAHFTVTGENEVGIDLVLIQPCLLYYVSHFVLMLTSSIL